MTAASLRRMQWAVRAALTLGVAASITANILHARPHPIAQAIAAWPPLALLITVELVSRIPIYRKSLGAVRVAATTAIAGIAAWVSYLHMMGVTARHGETGTVPYLLPLSVDGLIIVASVSLVELAGRIRNITTAPGHLTSAPATGSTPVHARPMPAPDTGTDASVFRHDQSTPEPYQPPAAVTGRHEQRGNGSEPDTNTDHNEPDPGTSVNTTKLAPDLVPLLSAARQAQDELVGEGRAVSRDALAARLRANGHPIRNTRVSELLATLKAETPSVNGSKPMTHV